MAEIIKTNDELVLRLQATIEEKRAALKPVKFSPITNCAFRYAQGGLVKNLNTVSDIPTLISMLATIMREFEFYNSAAEALDLENQTFMWEGFTFYDWKSDIETRVAVLNYQANKNQLDVLVKRLAALESDELKATKELEAIYSVLNKI